MEQQKDIRGGYRVPEGYFGNLEQSIMSKVEQREHPVSWWGALKRMRGFVLGFACLVVVAMVGYYFTGYQAQAEVQFDPSQEIATLYDLSEDDIINTMLADSSQNKALAQAAIEYVETYGIGLEDLQ